jgi:hypothetical protein
MPHRARETACVRVRHALAGVVLGFVLGAPLHAQLWINELMASNRSTITDSSGAFADWFEIHNAGASPIDLGGKYASDDPLNSRKWMFPAGLIVPAGGFLLLWADADPLQGIDHVGFHLDALLGEEISLFESDTLGHGLIDTVVYPPQNPDISLGRSVDGGPTWIYFTVSTPGASNNGGDPCDTVLCGDCNQDGFVNILDALRGAQHAAGVLTLTGAAFDNCNVNRVTGSIAVDILDALILARYDVGLAVTLSCCP